METSQAACIQKYTRLVNLRADFNSYIVFSIMV